MRRVVGTLLVLLALSAASCTSNQVPEVATTDVIAAEVVQTVAAAAELRPEARVTVNAPVGGEVAELLVGDGDVVAAGDPIVRLASDRIDQQVAQAEAAVEAAESIGTAAAGATPDLSPLLGAFQSQLDAVFPPVIEALRDQVDVLEAATETLAAAELPEFPEPGSAPGLVPVPDADEQPNDAGPSEDGAIIADDTDPDRVAGDDAGAGTSDPSEESPVPQRSQLVDPGALDQALAGLRVRVAEIEAGYRDARESLDHAMVEARQQTAAASESQQAAAEAQLEQAGLALQAAQARVEDLTVVAPEAGVVELARADPGGASGAPIPGLPGSPDGAGDLEGLLDGAGGAAAAGPLSEGIDVSPGQPLLTIFDLSGFTARVLVDELDVVDVAVGQRVTVLVDAFPQARLPGVVDYIALEPQRQAAGGSVYPVTVTLTDVPQDVALRVGLTASAEIETRRVESSTVVPTSALLRREVDEVVHVVRDGVAVQVPVRIVAIGESTAAVEGDLDTGEPVVSAGLEFVEDGEPVVIDAS